MRRANPRRNGRQVRGASSSPAAAHRGDLNQETQRDDVAPSKPPAQRAREAVDAWKAIGASCWVRRALQFGLRLPWLTPRGRPRRRCQPYLASKKEALLDKEELERWVSLGFVGLMTVAEACAAPCVSPAFVSWDRPDKARLVVDLRKENEHLRAMKLKYEALAEVMSSLVPGDHLISWGIKDAYHHVYIHLDNRPYLTFTASGQT